MDRQQFLEPRLCGDRFKEGGIPLEVLKDLAVLEEMVIEVAKSLYREQGDGRKRTPRGFLDGLELKLTGVEKGSAIPQISLLNRTGDLPGVQTEGQTYLEQAREAIIRVIETAQSGVTAGLAGFPERCLVYFDRLGRSLQDGEEIVFGTPSANNTARLTKETRRTLLLMSKQTKEYTEEVEYRGLVPELAQDKMTFEIAIISGPKVIAPVPVQHFETIFDAFSGYKDGCRVLVQGVGKFNRNNRLQAFESLEHISILDPLDVSARLDEFRALRAGWYNDDGNPLPEDGLDWLSKTFERNYPNDLPLPYTYPMPEGGIRFEWPLNEVEAILEVDLTSRSAIWYSPNQLEGDGKPLNLDVSECWSVIAESIRPFTGVGQ